MPSSFFHKPVHKSEPALAVNEAPFLMVKLFERFRKKEKKEEEKKEEAPKKSDEVLLLEEIRDLLAKNKK